VGLRPHQWIKNGLIFAPLAFSGRWNRGAEEPWADFFQWVHWPNVFYAGAGFVVFCLLSSAGYLINDIRDLDSDRRHPEKCRRPIAAGELPIRVALGAAVVLLGVALLGAAFLSLRGSNPSTWPFGVAALSYLLLTFSYSLFLKHKVMADVLTIALLFVLRVLGGCAVVPVKPSAWIITCTLFGALFMALCKRRHELLLAGGETGATRGVLREYSSQLLDLLIAIVCACVLMSYALYAITEPAKIGGKYEEYTFLLTLPLVIYGVFRYLYLAYNREIGETPELLFKDRGMLLCLALWAILVVVITSSRKIF